MVDNVVDNIANSSATGIASDRGLKLDLITVKADLDVKDWRKSISLVVSDVDLLG